MSEQAAAWLQVLEEDAQTSPVADVQAPEAPQTQGAGLAVAPSPWAQADNKHTENPDRVSDPSELHVIVSPALMLTPAGPLVPEYCVPPTVSLSQHDSVLKSSVTSTFPTSATLVTVIVHDSLLP